MMERKSLTNGGGQTYSYSVLERSEVVKSSYSRSRASTATASISSRRNHGSIIGGTSEKSEEHSQSSYYKEARHGGTQLLYSKYESDLDGDSCVQEEEAQSGGLLEQLVRSKTWNLIKSTYLAGLNFICVPIYWVLVQNLVFEKWLLNNRSRSRSLAVGAGARGDNGVHNSLFLRQEFVPVPVVLPEHNCPSKGSTVGPGGVGVTGRGPYRPDQSGDRDTSRRERVSTIVHNSGGTPPGSSGCGWLWWALLLLLLCALPLGYYLHTNPSTGTAGAGFADSIAGLFWGSADSSYVQGGRSAGSGYVQDGRQAGSGYVPDGRSAGSGYVQDGHSGYGDSSRGSPSLCTGEGGPELQMKLDEMKSELRSLNEQLAANGAAGAGAGSIGCDSKCKTCPCPEIKPSCDDAGMREVDAHLQRKIDAMELQLMTLGEQVESHKVSMESQTQSKAPCSSCEEVRRKAGDQVLPQGGSNRPDPGLLVMVEQMVDTKVNGILTEFSERQSSLIQDAIHKYDADKTGRPDLALESGGGSVVSTRCTKKSDFVGSTVSIFGIPIYYPSNSPRKVIQPGVMPGDCWSFEGTEGYLVIQLVGPTRMTGFTLEHLPKVLSPLGHIDSAPRKFQVVGLTNYEDTTTEFLFGEYEYEDNNVPTQYFPVQFNSETFFPYVELKILSNHGNVEYTCIYRLRVHGYLESWFKLV